VPASGTEANSTKFTVMTFSVVEIGAGMERQVTEAMRQAGLSDVSVRADLQRIARVVAGRRTPTTR